MGINEAKKYLTQLRKKQGDPLLWPDFLTGLPDVGAVLRKVEEVYPKLGKMSISYVRIANVHPYLIKYGPDAHSDIIQWAAASLKTTADKYKGFVGAFGRHDFVVICSSKDMAKVMKEAAGIFQKKALSYYSKDDLRKKSVLSFEREGEQVNIGFMKLIHSTLNEKTKLPADNVISHLGGLLRKLERTTT